MNMTTVPSNQLKEMQQEIADLKEQLAQLAEDMKYVTNAKLIEAKCVIAQQAEAIRLKDEHILQGNLSLALSIQPSPEILQARDKRVAEAITKYLRAVGVLSYEGTALQGIISGEWRKYL